MGEKYISDTAVEALLTNLQTHDVEEFYVEYQEVSKPLASEIAVALQKAQWTKQPEIVSYGASIPDRPDIEIETRTSEPEDGVQVLVEWLEAQNLSINHTHNPNIGAVAIRVDHAD